MLPLTLLKMSARDQESKVCFLVCVCVCTCVCYLCMLVPVWEPRMCVCVSRESNLLENVRTLQTLKVGQ